ncbi:hypothetical protein [Paraburkholderia sp. BR14374]|uniref:hypothetical protein n=1 Tax=Paraburkholderia sp. BR14374 TaxID=3237007 RepID=UPI0034CE737B
MRGKLHRQNKSLAQRFSGFASSIRRDSSDNEVIDRLRTLDCYAVRKLPGITGPDKQPRVPRLQLGKREVRETGFEFSTIVPGHEKPLRRPAGQSVSRHDQPWYGDSLLCIEFAL